METLRRLRFVWAILCMIAAALCAVAVFVPPQPVAALPWAIAALLAGTAFYLGQPIKVLTALWCSGAALFFGALVNVMPAETAALRTAVFFGGGWALTAVAVWIMQPALRRLGNRPNP